MKYNIKFRRFMSAGLSAALALSLAVPSFALDGKEVKGEPAVGGDSEVTVQVLCDHGHTHWDDNGDGTHDETCDDCGDVVTDDEPHSDDDGNGVCDKCGENSHQVLIASIPVVLPIMAKVDGSVTVPSNAEITNLTEGRAIRVKDLDVTLSGDWSLVDGNTTFTEADKGSKLLAMGFRGTPVAADGSMDMTQSDWSIAIDGSLPLEMRAAIPAQTQKSAESSIGKVTFTLDWAEGSVDPEPEPPVEEVATAFNKTLLDNALKTAKTITVTKGAPEDGIDISQAQDRTVLATRDGDEGFIYLNNAYLTYTGSMFRYFRSLTSLDVSDFDTSKVTDMSYMFGSCYALTSLDVSSFDTSNVTNMSYMFYCCEGLTSLDLSNWDTSKTAGMNDMFNGCKALYSLNVSKLNTGNVTDTSRMFYDCCALPFVDVSTWDTGKVIHMELMFYNCKALTSLDTSSWDTKNVNYMQRMFGNCKSLSSIDVSNFDTSKAIFLWGMFENCSSLTSLNVSKFNTENTTSMSSMFSGCSSLPSLDVSAWNTSKTTNMNSMFKGCSKLSSLDVSNFDTSKVTDVYWMFGNCYALSSIDVFSWDTSKIEIAYNLFYNCYSLVSLDISNWDASNMANIEDIFSGCSSLTPLYVKDEAAKAKISGSNDFPSTCTIVVGSPA